MKKIVLFAAAFLMSVGGYDALADNTPKSSKDENLVEKVEDGTVKTAKKVGKFSKDTYKKAEKGTVKTAKKVGKFSEKTYDKAKDGTVKTAKKVGKFSKKTFNKAKNGVKDFFEKDK